MAITILPNVTRRAVCKSCGVAVGLYPATPVGTARPASEYDAQAVVGRGLAVHALPALDPTVRWECPACDAPNKGA
jgi:hypothetical protein